MSEDKKEKVSTDTNKKKPKSKLLIKPKANINLSKTKAKVDMKFGDKINAQLQGYVKTKSLLKGDDKLKGSLLKGKIKYTKGVHSIEGKGEYKPDTKDATGQLIYKVKF